MPGEELTNWTIRLSLGCYVIVVAGGLLARRVGGESNAKARLCEKAGLLCRESFLRWFWTTGCVLVWVHVFCVFQFYHHWSHAAAVEHTARETAAVVGWNWGGGIWFNYLFLLAWTADVVWWWISPISHASRFHSLRWFLHAYLAFIIFNATVVFKTGGWRWVGTGVFMMLAAMAVAAALGQSRRTTSAAETGE